MDITFTPASSPPSSSWTLNGSAYGSSNNVSALDDGTNVNNVTAADSETGAEMDVVMAYVYFYLTGIMSTMSMMGSVVLVCCYSRSKAPRTTGRKLLVYLSVADFLTAAGNLLGITWYKYKDTLSEASCRFFCEFHAALTFFSSISSFLWTTIIAIHLFMCIVRWNSSEPDKLLPIFHLICWILPASIACLAWGLGVIGWNKSLNLPSWCWIDPHTQIVHPMFWHYVTGKAWEIAAYLISIILYASIKASLRKQLNSKSKSSLGNGMATKVITEANRKLTLVPAVFIAVRIWGTIRFLLGAHFPAAASKALWIVPLQGIGDSAQGFANFLLFCVFTNSTKQFLARRCCGKNESGRASGDRSQASCCRYCGCCCCCCYRPGLQTRHAGSGRGDDVRYSKAASSLIDETPSQQAPETISSNTKTQTMKNSIHNRYSADTVVL